MSVCLSVVTLVSPGETAEAIELPFALRTRVGPSMYVLDRVQMPMERGNFEGERGKPLQSIGHFVVICAKTAEPIEVPFVLWARIGPRNHTLDGGPDHPMRMGNFGG